ncbi:osmotic avoidance abnormal protein 3 isoform X2 [Contarinia nasturtii]|uniref:osmotic avoidance abnormal protein 3 isoform X2 n=1 Tax=Contarinia nasturtii TaxID=265458 RepID=UPI0012D4BB82|nr:osmotic avoidance abnormal protein 3 isoform X2 [Contarinia nasturtii]
MAENVKVIVRCRPMNEKERNMKCKNIIKVAKCMVSIQNPADLTAPSKEFRFDSAYDAKSSTESIYNDICYPLVENVLEGYNGTVFAYGQTGCGKSHTMQGPDVPSGILLTSEQIAQRGLISRSFDHIFEAMSVTAGVRYLPLVSYLEIYNENIRDLLNPSISSGTLVLKEQPNEGVVVQHLSTHAVHSAEECEQLLAIGTKNRMVGATLMNAGSSRSHSIFVINLEQITTSNGAASDEENVAIIKKGKLNLVDLAGSERQAKTGATGDRLKEATKINLSLSALGNVISALVDGKSKHIPYRDSKLTRLLQDSLGGNTKTIMIACISPAEFNYDETLSTLRYASRAKNISNRPVINEDPKDAMLREYQAEISQLKAQLANTAGTSGIESPMDLEMKKNIEEEKERLANFYEAETERLKNEHESQRKEKEELMNDMEKLKMHYEEKIAALNTQSNKLPQNNEVINKIQALKSSLVGGECSNNTQLKEKRRRKKLAAEQRMNAITKALDMCEHSEARDILQGHYTDFQQELKMKTDALKAISRKAYALEREVSDLQSEFQLDRTDYLETIRKLEKNLKFYQQLIELSLPYLRKSGRLWDPETIKHDSIWNEDLNKWKLPEDSMSRLRLPPADNLKTFREAEKEEILESEVNHNFEADMYLEKLEQDNEKKMERSDSNDILCTYFRPRRAAELIHQNKVANLWKDYSKKTNRTTINNWMTPTALANNLSSPSSATWQPIPNSATLKSLRNPNGDRTLHSLRKPFVPFLRDDGV